MRLTSAIWVSAYIRRCHLEGAFAVVRRRGAAEAGAIFVKLDRLDGTAALFAPAPQSLVDEDVLDFFKREGAGYQRRINAVLRSYMQQKAKPKKRA